jgi:hypothetical protein
LNALAVSQETLAVALFDPLARVPAAVADVDPHARNDFGHTGIGAFLVRALATRYPVVRLLIGDDSFLDVVQRFIAMQLPRLPIAQHFGDANLTIVAKANVVVAFHRQAADVAPTTPLALRGLTR